jgi:sugar lactone lactonase YvrE
VIAIESAATGIAPELGRVNVTGRIQGVTNVAFGGADHMTLYITALGNQKGLF